MITHFVRNEYFSVDKWEISGKAVFEQSHPFLLCSVIEGERELLHKDQRYKLIKGEHFLLPVDVGTFILDGQLQLIVFHI